MKSKFLAWLSLILIATLVLAGCGSSGGGGGGDTAAPASSDKADSGGGSSDKGGSPVTLKLWTFVELHQKFYESMADRWNKEHPDMPIKLEAQTFPYDDMHNKLLVALQSGVGAPDIADIEINKFPNYLKGTPQLLPLNDIIEPELGNIVKARVDIYSKDGKYYGVPFHVGAEVMYYNKEILDQAGVNPDNIKTWDDFEAAGKQVLEKTGKPMTTLETQDLWSFWPLVSQQGSDFIDKDGKIILDNDTNLKTLEFLQKLVKEKIAIAAPGGGHHAEEYYGFMNKGGAASVWMPFWYMGRFTDYMPDLKGKIIMRPAPAWTAGGFRSAGMGGTGTAVTKQAKNPDLAKKFLAYAKLSEEGGEQIWTQLGFDPVRKQVWESDAVKQSNKFTDYFGNNIFDVLKEISGEINPVNITPMTPVTSDVVRKEVMFKTIHDMQDPAAVLKAAADELRQQQQ